ncbi:glycosyltransferase family 1 protein [Calocera viscosa TUFC12733]|uniref:UDP-N-acetylglucosamine transferase subunit ALG14 n=1 Tax=Calocera viscosa (strain TUFC12733) TaxID=1330018 RepID=A0A167IMZ4_CALVF|nr:glycosyltransferase family 1 protein [Calocera viscosa TUFC12733]
MTLLLYLPPLLLLLAARVYSILPHPSHSKPRQKRTSPCKIAVFLGSGGHTSESLQLLSALPARYAQRVYILSSGDNFSQQKAAAFELSLSSATTTALPGQATHTFLLLPRARHVHQPLYLTPPTFLLSLLAALYNLTLLPLLRGERFADLLLLNGPGTCVTVLAAVYVSKFLGLPAPRTVYVESFARVRSLSLSGKLVRPFVDRFVVQWPEALGDGRGECGGWLV